jgi:aromatic amino acid aminotransferase I
MGWFTCNPLFAERFERAGETSTQAPSGFAQSMITQLVVKTWGMEGYVRWLKGIKAQYTARRDALIDAMMNELDISLTKGTGILEGATVFEGSIKESGRSAIMEKKRRIVVSFVPPTSGMFVWVSCNGMRRWTRRLTNRSQIKVNFEGLPPPVAVPDEEPNEGTHEGRFWVQLAEKGLLILPGWVFRGEKDHAPVDPNLAGHYRVSFSDPTVSCLPTFPFGPAMLTSIRSTRT